MSEVPKGVANEWKLRVEAEYASAALSAELLHWLFQLGVSPDSLEDCHRVIADELVHADLSRDVFLAAGGDEAAITIDGRRLVVPHLPGSTLFERALHVCADFYCCGETVARPLFREMQVGATVAVARKALDRIAKDEARHSGFGWALLAELLERASAAERETLAQQLPTYLRRISQGYGGELTSPTDAISDVERAWGLLSPETYKSLSTKGRVDLIQPRFEKHGFGPFD